MGSHGNTIAVDSIRFNATGTLVVSGSSATTILLHVFETGVVVWSKACSSLYRVCFSASDVFVVAGHSSGLVEFLSAQSGEVVLSGSLESADRQSRGVTSLALPNAIPPWQRIGPLRELCVALLASSSSSAPSLHALPVHLREEIEARARSES
eukprot:TRINITY_DN9915_c0_g1_i1.p1 TRINITY_DN9915_c0_g1~~TRINITY_DN9915_c0_g1_i1.p1  ORF type:complete len:153 (-),score=30.89 TRINITY_DN9915_c0_g1_i1:31-489(-)